MNIVHSSPHISFCSSRESLFSFFKDALLLADDAFENGSFHFLNQEYLFIEEDRVDRPTPIVFKIEEESWSELWQRVEFWYYRFAENSSLIVENVDDQLIIIQDKNGQKWLFSNGVSSLDPKYFQ